MRQGFDTLQGVTVVELEQNVVASELGFVGTADVVMAEVLVHVLQRLDAFRQVLVVQLPIKLARFLKINKNPICFVLKIISDILLLKISSNCTKTVLFNNNTLQNTVSFFSILLTQRNL